MEKSIAHLYHLPHYFFSHRKLASSPPIKEVQEAFISLATAFRLESFLLSASSAFGFTGSLLHRRSYTISSLLKLPSSWLEGRDQLINISGLLTIIISPLILLEESKTLFQLPSIETTNWALVASDVGIGEDLLWPFTGIAHRAIDITKWILFRPLFTAVKVAKFVVSLIIFHRLQNHHPDHGAMGEQLLIISTTGIDLTATLLSLSALQPQLQVFLAITASIIGTIHLGYNWYHQRELPENSLAHSR